MVFLLSPLGGRRGGKKDHKVFQGEWVGEANHGNAVYIIKAERFAYHQCNALDIIRALSEANRQIHWHRGNPNRTRPILS